MAKLYHKITTLSIVSLLCLFFLSNVRADYVIEDLRTAVNEGLIEIEFNIKEIDASLRELAYKKSQLGWLESWAVGGNFDLLMRELSRLNRQLSAQCQFLRQFQSVLQDNEVTEDKIDKCLQQLLTNNAKLLDIIRRAKTSAEIFKGVLLEAEEMKPAAEIQKSIDKFIENERKLTEKGVKIKALIDGHLIRPFPTTDGARSLVSPPPPSLVVKSVIIPNTSALRLIVIRAGLELKNEYPNIRIKNTDIEVFYWREANVLRIFLEVDYDGDGPQEKKLITIDLPVGEQLTAEYILRFIKNVLNSEGWRPATTDYSKGDLISSTDLGIERNRTEMENWTAFFEYLPTVEARRGSVENLRFAVLELLADLAYKDMLMKDLKNKLTGPVTKEEINRLLTDINEKNIDIVNDLYSKDSIYTWLYVPATRTFNDPKLREQLQFLREMRKATLERYRYTKDIID